MHRLFPAALAALLASPAAIAAPDETALRRYLAGEYDGAVAAALAAGGAENYALAARAQNAVAYFEDGRKSARRAAQEALDYAEQAIAADAELPEGHLQAAIGLGLRGANMAPVRAFLLDLPSRVRRHLDDALALDPDNPWALSTSAAWRLEVARRGGGGVYGADPQAGYAEFVMARTVAPDNIPIAFECALRLLSSRRPEWRAAALEALAVALEAEPQSAFEAGVKERARALKLAVEEGPEAVAEFVRGVP